MKRTIADIRENLPFVGCDNETAAEMLDEIERLRAEIAELSSHYGTQVTWDKDGNRIVTPLKRS
jgi:hypothetical protein